MTTFWVIQLFLHWNGRRRPKFLNKFFFFIFLELRPVIRIFQPSVGDQCENLTKPKPESYTHDFFSFVSVDKTGLPVFRCPWPRKKIITYYKKRKLNGKLNWRIDKLNKKQNDNQQTLFLKMFNKCSIALEKENSFLFISSGLRAV